ncbi:chromosome segregation protein SMC [Amphibacillus sp. MSJ-3]|uniref:chromosome segregation protein SMC n=1 Tax=Amphibacillus sp. MSJ-3 TaxID=2841505 RepID=UPI001C0EE576|nr:chromosome segregation protein SMC [Amphibacillus sp. MSJ-3]MBU5594589.1 chromosome segregation protein SMC [Amphibacillus sp. MSJ-3]
MFLKRLESVGFKSFAEPISVDFVPGVTAVVGPNGSGKSNVTDAIRWVLGEQSVKSLRGSKMEDIIFQGSDTRKPLNVAEVTLILDNQDRTLPIDYQEVSVTRRVYRSGESEFYLNKQSCRLKDIIDLFLDSGLGREAFSIIGQGKIEEILSSKAEERRTIFEEAAGVLKYKNRKKKAEYKLAETQENLNRVEDIIFEIEGQLEPLKQQSSKAKEYLTQRGQLKEAEITLLRTEIETLHNEWQEYLTKIDHLKEDEHQITVDLQVKAAQVEKEQHRIEQLDQIVEEYQQKLLTLTESFEKLTGQKNVILERAKHTTENKEKLTLQLSDLTEQVKETEEQYNEENKKLVQIKETRKSTSDELNKLQQHLSLDQGELDDQIESYKADYIEKLNQQATRKHALKTIDQQLNRMTNQKEVDLSKQSTHNNEYKQLQQQKQKLVKKDQEIKVEIDQLNEEINNKTMRYNQEKEILFDMQSKLEQGIRQIDRLQSRKEMLDEMKEDFQGFYSGVKAVLKAREQGRINSIHGAVIELIEIPERYLIALETALANQAQQIVVADEKAGREAIDYLKQQNKGRATFLPLNVIKAKIIPNHYQAKLKTHPGFIAIASEIPKTDAPYQIVVDYLLGNTIIAQTLKDANEIARLIDRRYRVVTLEGDIVNPGGSMTGGARKATNQSLFTRDKELQTLSDKIVEFQQRTDVFKQKIEEKSTLVKQYDEELAKLSEKRETAKIHLQQNDGALNSNQIQLSHYEKELKIAQQDQAQRVAEYRRLEAEKQENEASLSELKREIEQINKRVEQLTKEKEDFEKNKAKLQSEIQALEIKEAEEKKELSYQTEKVNSLEGKLINLRTTIKQVEVEIAEIVQIEAGIEHISDIDQKIAINEDEKHTVTETIQNKRKERMMLTKTLSDCEAKHRLLQDERQALITERQAIEVKANRLDVELENRLIQLQEEYELSFEKAKECYEKTDDLQLLRKKVKLIKRTIEELGTVNLGAIDEYDRIAERYQFLTTQQIDLQEAKTTLYAVINEMDQEMEQRFDETFSQIKNEFTDVFRQLFGGGHAELTLTDPSSLLTTGVEIKAQPPGKKAQQLALLSGGERALTAIALLFAILRVRPVPFCVLDEVEAALDEANVERFSHYLKTYSKETQFIVITHRKGTMEGADVLYGVTMQESGVSRFVSVKLEETDQLLETK